MGSGWFLVFAVAVVAVVVMVVAIAVVDGSQSTWPFNISHGCCPTHGYPSKPLVNYGCLLLLMLVVVDGIQIATTEEVPPGAAQLAEVHALNEGTGPRTTVLASFHNGG